MKLKIVYKEAFYETLIRGLIKEGVYDKTIFKAVFLAGGPGSGKSYVSSTLLSGYGLKSINIDTPFEHLMKKHSLDLKMPDSEKDKRLPIRQKSNILKNRMESDYVDGRLGIIIDGTGKDYNIIADKAEELKSIGYDVKMVYVMTQEQVAIDRNLSRERSLPIDLVKQIWKESNKNMRDFQKYFGPENFYLVNNDEVVDDENTFREMHSDIDKAIRKFINQKINNPIARVWIDNQLKLKMRN